MKQLMRLTTAASALVALMLISSPPRAAEHENAKHFDKCAKICAECQVECDSCFQHCANMVAAGKKDHMRSMQLCLDCAEVCLTASRLSARKSDLAVPACDACARVCEMCAAECEKFSDDKKMAACAKMCHDCAKECRAMIKHVSTAEEKK